VPIPRLEPHSAGVLLIDVQPAFVETAFPSGGAALEALMLRLEHLLMLSGWLGLPTITTFETPTSENGELTDNLEAVFPKGGQRFVKSFFGCMSEPDISAAVQEAGVRQWLVAGAETDVCVLQSTLGLLEAGFEVHLLEDCLFTTEKEPGPALRRMFQSGAVPTTLKTAAYELVQQADQIPWYPDLWALGFELEKPFPENFIPPEQWPDWEATI